MGLFDFLRPKPQPEETPMNESIGVAGGVIGSFDQLQGAEMVGAGLEGNYIGDSFYDTGGVFGRNYNPEGILEVERSYIQQQRLLALYPEVAIGIEEIMRDLFDKKDPLSLEFEATENDDTEGLLEAFSTFAANPFKTLNTQQTPHGLLMFNLIRQVYIDGHMLMLACNADVLEKKSGHPAANGDIPGSKPRKAKTPKVNPKDSLVHGYKAYRPGINKDAEYLTESEFEALLETSLLEVDKETKSELVFIPLDPARLARRGDRHFYDIRRDRQVELDSNKLIQADFGLFDVLGARFGFLQYARKYANQLQSLQDMLIPMRFRRSIARRVFNVDVGGLPSGRSAEYMKDLQKRFKYKKHYDVESGKIVSRDNDPTGIVEDYWFANRNGNRGTTVETLDESGNFADSLEDISYFNKKLYQSMFIPLRRVFESDADYDYTSSSIEADELRFHSFLNRVRFVFDTVFTRMFKIWIEHYHPEFKDIEARVYLRYDNGWEEEKEREQFQSSIDMFEQAKEHLGKAYSAETMMKRVFGMTADDVKYEMDKIMSELNEDSIFFRFYKQAAQEESE